MIFPEPHLFKKDFLDNYITPRDQSKVLFFDDLKNYITDYLIYYRIPEKYTRTNYQDDELLKILRILTERKAAYPFRYIFYLFKNYNSSEWVQFESYLKSNAIDFNEEFKARTDYIKAFSLSKIRLIERFIVAFDNRDTYPDIFQLFVEESLMPFRDEVFNNIVKIHRIFKLLIYFSLLLG